MAESRGSVTEWRTPGVPVKLGQHQRVCCWWAGRIWGTGVWTGLPSDTGEKSARKVWLGGKGLGVFFRVGYI